MEPAASTEVIPRGRSPTKKKHSTNAAAARTTTTESVDADDDDSFEDEDEQGIDDDNEHSSSSSSSSGIFLYNLALFGDSTMALVASFLLLVVAVVLSFQLDDETTTTANDFGSLSALLSSSWWSFDYGGSEGGRGVGNSFDTDPCVRNPDAVPALQPGQLNTLFARIVSTATTSNNEANNNRSAVVVHSGPSIESSEFRSPPWIVTIDDFLSDEECDTLIQHGYEMGYRQSIDVEKLDSEYGRATTNKRTSETAWCSIKNGCRNQTTPHQIHQRISNLLEIPTENSEDFQLLKYEVGQYYKVRFERKSYCECSWTIVV
jgi:hypothetical protein